MKNVKHVRHWMIVALTLGFVFIFLVPDAEDDDIANGQEASTYKIEPISVDSTVLSRGTLKPAVVMPIKSQISGSKSKLVWMAPDGYAVKQGETIAQFDTTKYEEELIRAEQSVEDAKATYEAAEKALILQKEEEVKKTENASRQLEVARLQAKDLLEGSGKLLKERLQLELDQATRTYVIAQAELADYDLLLEKGHVSQREREKAADTARKYDELKTIKQKELANFEQYEWPKIKREAEILAEQAEADYLRAVRVSELELQKRENDKIKTARDLIRAQKRLAQINDNIIACDVKAPIDGQLYHTVLPRPEGARKIQIGDTIWAGQTFMEIPDTQQFVLESFVREFDVSEVKEGQLVEITLDAFPEKTLTGRVTVVSHVVDAEQDVNQFKVISALSDNFNGMHLGMSGTVSITTAIHEDVLAVPLKYVQFNQGSPVVNILVDGEMTQQRVTLAHTSSDWQIIATGVSQGDVVAL